LVLPLEIHFIILDQLDEAPSTYIEYACLCKLTNSIVISWDPWNRLITRFFSESNDARRDTISQNAGTDPIEKYLRPKTIDQQTPARRFGSLWLADEERTRGKCAVRGSRVFFGSISAMQVGEYFLDN
jgi:hypothetical protein